MFCLKCNQETSNPRFCSRSCSASYNNILHPKRSVEGNCKRCQKSITSNLTYCTECWKTIRPTIAKFSAAQSQHSSLLCRYCKAPLNTRRKFCNVDCEVMSQFLAKVKRIEQQGYFYTSEVFRTGNSVEFVRKYIKYKHGDKCAICGQPNTWNGKPLNLILDHINGIPNDWSISNLRLVCHHCDSQLPTYKSKNIGHGRLVIVKRGPF